MCGRFSLDRKPKELEIRFKAKLRIQSYFPLYNIAPTMKTACIPVGDPAQIELMEWGLGGKGKDGKSRSLINARIETIREKWPFRDLVTQKRCLIPASGYIEWKTVGQMKIPYLHQLAGGALFAMAGVFDLETAGIQGENSNLRFSILTKESSGVASEIHDRMPVILKPDEEAQWLESPEILTGLAMKNREPDQLIRSFPISHKINGSFENNPAFLEKTQYSIAEQLRLF